jgi:sterol carrier protein 2
MTTARVVEVGMLPFCKPGNHQPYRVMAAKAITAIAA